MILEYNNTSTIEHNSIEGQIRDIIASRIVFDEVARAGATFPVI